MKDPTNIFTSINNDTRSAANYSLIVKELWNSSFNELIMRIHNATFNLCHRKQHAVNKERAKSEKKREA